MALVKKSGALKKRKLLYADLHTNKGVLEAMLLVDYTPSTCQHFVQLVQKEFYNELLFFKKIDDYIIQTGCKKNNGTGHANKFIKCEIEGNPVSHDRGTISMAHCARDKNSSQFFIALAKLPSLDDNHSLFAKIDKGIEVLDKLEEGDKLEKITLRQVILEDHEEA